MDDGETTVNYTDYDGHRSMNDDLMWHPSSYIPNRHHHNYYDNCNELEAPRDIVGLLGEDGEGTLGE
ncbi:MAG: hypothetical protein ACKPKO_65370, partial [Candidatus Fonsibacter sp.]